MIVVFSAVLLNSIELITTFTEPTASNESSGDCSDTKITNKKNCESDTSTEELLVYEDTSGLDSRELFHYVPITYPTEPSTRPTEIRPRAPAYSTTTSDVLLAAEGAFFNFTLDLYQSILGKFQSRKIGKYFKILGSKLRGSTTRRRSCESFLRLFVNHLARKAKILSRYRVSKIKEKIRGIMNDTLEQTPRRVAFFKAMNSLYTLKYQLMVDAYIYYLRGYGRGLETDRRMTRETKILFRNVIFYLLDKQEDEDRNDIIMKLMLAYEEYYS